MPAWLLLLLAAVVAARSSGAAPPPPAPWRSPNLRSVGAYDVNTCEATPVFWPPHRSVLLLESICTGPSASYHHSPFGYYPQHAEISDASYTGQSYFRVRSLATGSVIANISSSRGFGFGSAFVDAASTPPVFWIFGTPWQRSNGGPDHRRPDGPPAAPASCHNKSLQVNGSGSFPDIPEALGGPLRCGGVWSWRSTDLMTWTRSQTDVRWSGANTRVTAVGATAAAAAGAQRVGGLSGTGRAHGGGTRRLPPHRFVMATERGGTYAFNDQPDLTKGWRTLRFPEHSGVLACPSIHYVHPHYYTISGGGHIVLQRSTDLLQWEAAADMFVRPSAADVHVSPLMRSAAANLGLLNFSESSAPFYRDWDTNANDADFCCQPGSGLNYSLVIWGADDQGGSVWGRQNLGVHAVAAAGVAEMPLDELLQSYFNKNE